MSETWRPVVGCEGCYEVSDLGRVRSLDRSDMWIQRVRGGGDALVTRTWKGKILRPGVASNGYPTVALRLQTRTVHSLVARAFLGPRPEGLEICHSDGNRLNARLANLRYGTPQENAADSDVHGTRIRGSRYLNAKLNETSARHIRSLKGKIPQSELAKRYRVSSGAVQAVHDGRTWTHA